MLSFAYRLSRLPFVPERTMFRLLLDLHWIFWRLAMERGERIFGFRNEAMRRRNIEFLLNRTQPKHRVMDLGCKHGHISALLAERVAMVIGVDQDADALDLARSLYKLPNLEFVHEDAFRILQNEKGKFDVVVLSHIIEHLDRPEELLLRLKDHCRFVYIEVPDLDATYLNHYRIMVNAGFQYTDNDHIWEFDRDSLEALLISCEYKIDASEHRYGLQKYWCSSPLNDDMARLP